MTRSVALAGDVFDPSGTLTGGARPKTSSILTKLGELLNCEQLLQEKERELKQVTAQLQDIQKVANKWVCNVSREWGALGFPTPEVDLPSLEFPRNVSDFPSPEELAVVIPDHESTK